MKTRPTESRRESGTVVVPPCARRQQPSPWRVEPSSPLSPRKSRPGTPGCLSHEVLHACVLHVRHCLRNATPACPRSAPPPLPFIVTSSGEPSPPHPSGPGSRKEVIEFLKAKPTTRGRRRRGLVEDRRVPAIHGCRSRAPYDEPLLRVHT